MDSLQIRNIFQDFYAERGHRRYESASLIANDPTLLLTVAGMVPFKDYMSGDAVPPSRRAVSYQKCVRTSDIENVGRTSRHLSMFEMLGNFSFGDYFKKQAIAWAWELAVDGYGFDPERLWATHWDQDEDSAGIWLSETDIPASRIQALGKEDNFWSMGVAGPCGPNTEIFYDRGPEHGEEGGPAVDGERFLEFYNVVFMEFMRDDAGNILGDLPQQNVDTGMGLERMAVLLQDVPDIFHTDTFRPLIRRAEEITGVAFGANDESDVSLRVVAEHMRTSAFLVGDGVLPAKEGRGYVLRMLARRAIRHGQLLGLEPDAELAVPMVEAVMDTMGEMYPDLVKQKDLVLRVLEAEGKDFGKRLASGMEMLETAIEAEGGADATSVGGDVAFKLHDTHGFPIDLTVEIAADRGLALDRDEFDVLMNEQRERARAAAKKGDGGITAEQYREAAASVGATEFLGYDSTTTETSIGALVNAGGVLSGASEGDLLEVILPRSPFYAEAGGQVGDRGTLITPTARLEVLDTQEPIAGVLAHRVRVVAGEVAPGQQVEAIVDAERRLATGRSHSATHLVHATLKEILGDHAQQAGSLNEPGRLRFDFPHFSAVSAEELAQLEQLVNERVIADPRVRTDVLSIEDAKASGAVANFGDKYGEVVRVVSIGEWSKELCGGTHVGNAARIGAVTIIREESVGANTRRIQALVGLDAHAHLVREKLVAEQVSQLLNVPTGQAVERLESLMDRLKAADKELASVKAANIAKVAAELANDVERVDGVAILTAALEGVGMDDLRAAARQARERIGTRGVVVFGTASDDGKAQLICMLTKDLADAGVQARTILHPAAQVVGGGAGGKGDMAQAGGKRGEALAEALQVAAREARAALAGGA